MWDASFHLPLAQLLVSKAVDDHDLTCSEHILVVGTHFRAAMAYHSARAPHLSTCLNHFGMDFGKLWSVGSFRLEELSIFFTGNGVSFAWHTAVSGLVKSQFCKSKTPRKHDLCPPSPV